MLYLPIYPAMGNHEQNSAFYYRYFSSLTGGSCFYSFTWGAAHFVVLCLDEGNSISSEQIEWLKNDLEENRDATFKVVYHHVPPYFSSPADAAGSEQLRTVLVPLYEENGVDLVFSGDVHSYQHHLKNNIHYLISAGGGERPSECGLPLEGMTLSLFKTYHFIHAMVDGTSIHLTAYDLDGTVLDRLTLESGQISEVSSSIAVSVSSQEVVPGGECQVDLFIQNVQNLDSVSCTLEYKKDEPPAALQAVDADPNTAGIQVIQGDLGGEVTVNEADNGLGVLHYQEQHIGGRSAAKIKVATIKFNVPEDTQPTAFYLVPRCILRDAAGAEIVHFMGGVKMVVKKSEP